jgi:hypothetical protein
MASVNTVYTALKNLANKDQRGFITPAVFNSFAGVAQLNVYNSLFDKLALGKQHVHGSYLGSVKQLR